MSIFINKLVQWLIIDDNNLIIFAIVGDAYLQQRPFHEHMTRHTTHERIHIQLGVVEQCPRDEKV